MHRHVTSAFVVVTLLASASCTILYAFNSSEENLPCGPDDGTPRCQEGFACVRADDGVERCVVAGFKKVGEPCTVNAECEDGSVCADAWATRCHEGESSLDCALVDQADVGLRCRALCDEDFSCPSGTRCFASENDGDAPFCQEGTCAEDSDCVAGGVTGLCIEEDLSGGRSGLCRVRCDPLACFDRGADCPCLADESCATPVDETVSSRAVCAVTGGIGEGLTCNAANPCADGLTCALRNDGVQVCVRWCAVGGGAPACGAGTACAGVDPNEPALGVCQ